MPKRKLIRPTKAEEERINRGIAQDPDNPEWTDEDFKRARPASEVEPEIVAEYRRTRGPQKAPTKERISIRLDRDVVAHFRATGPGWQGLINEKLRSVMRSAKRKPMTMTTMTKAPRKSAKRRPGARAPRKQAS